MLPLFAGLIATVMIGTAAAGAQTMPVYMDSSQPVAKRVDDLVGRMTLEEKVSQMQNHAAAIPRLDVPEYDWWSEGLHGIARSGYATVFPQAIGLAATWDTPLMHEVATTISTEARAKNAEALRHGIHSIYFGLDVWSPNINIFRDPRWGRGQETYGEDPFLTSRMGVSFVEGLQGDDPHYFKTIATPKHYVVHSGPESTRHTANIDVSPHDLEDTYLPAFRATVKEAKAGSVMCAYNAIDGEPACANTFLLSDTLRKTWGFKGYVTSDCGAITDVAEGHKFAPDIEHASAVSVKAGTDTSCGDEYPSLTKAVKDGLISEAEIDQSVKRLFTARFELGMFDPASKVAYARIPFSEDDSVAHRELALHVAEKSMVLLKNDGILPLKKSVKTIAVIGPNAAALSAIEGNYNAIPSHPVLPLSGMEAKFGGQAKVLYAQGSPYVSELTVPVPRTVFHPAKGSAAFGLKGEYFDNVDLKGKPVVTRVDQQVDFDWNAAAPVPGVKAAAFGVRWTGTITPPVPGKYEFNFRGEAKDARVFLDGKEVTAEQASTKKHSRRTEPFVLDLSDGQAHDLRIEYAHQTPLFDAGLSLEWKPPVEAERAEAVKTAEQADVVVAFVGLSPNLEGEEMPVHVEGFDGGDRTEIELPAVQKEMLKAVAATGKPVIVVLMNGSALAVKWAKDNAAAVLEAWYPGEEGGAAIANTLAGDNNPAGRLPITFYTGTKELPPFDDYSMKNRTYRYFTGTTLWGFGYGLSYSKFKWSDVKLSTEKLAAGEPLTLDAEVENTGAAKGDAVSEIYLKAPASATAPIHSLVGFVRTPLDGHARQHVHVVIGPRNLSTVAADGKRSIEAGEYTLFVGDAQPGADDNGITKQFTVIGSKELPR
ncbi:glycoside hydrolase family 3 C-terminal domain-containing protein [Granulicella sp. L56]|uniref:glycoside hydrolase family 3 C-terminal domain-containing protein n=1 Tax=Granulicella sp. L56 TaxID=1747222 RepID=UPI0020B1267E|nr:glycoside hydrolase family 3 C-terminal domain-containing protein [Granulicella sp. L56]